MSHFSPVSAAAGGVLIGLATAWLWLSLGRVAGISGIVGAIASGDADWRLAFLAGLIATPLLLTRLGMQVGWAAPSAGIGVLALGGVLVGFGTRLGGGCTSGHAVCGLARLSPRSAVATGIFMLSAACVVAAVRHLVVS